MTPWSQLEGVGRERDERSWVDAVECWLSELPAVIGAMPAVLLLAFGVVAVVGLMILAVVGAIF